MENIPVTKVFLPPQEEYDKILKRAWDRRWITNRGILVQELEEQLKKYLSSDHLIVMCNGTLPLQIAIRALGLSGEIITTPFSYVATTSSIVWEHCRPVFVDIDPLHLTIDESKIEEAITPETSAILATHVFGNPCNVEVIESIAARRNLKVIYDAAHCFGVKYKNQPVFNYGDISTCSFHATKLFHTGEGGAIFCRDKELHDKLFYSHNFGHNGPLAFHGLGINAKISELQAAMGLAVFPYVPDIIAARKKSVAFYDGQFLDSPLQRIKIREGAEWNYSYYPVLFRSEEELDNVLKALNAENIFPRRYFYPSLNTIAYTLGASMPVSESVAARVLCLPLYFDLAVEDQERISTIIKTSMGA